MVGNALYDYIVSERPESKNRQVFLGENRPHDPITAGAVFLIASKIYDAAAIRMEKGMRRGSHLFRYNAATTFFSNGIKAYDAMLSFDKNIGTVNGLCRTPYQWLQLICQKCGVPLGMTEAEVSAMTNGTGTFTLVQTDDIKSYRDLLSHVACVLCGVSQIDRSGNLVIRQFLTAGAENIPADRRFSSTLADYITRYTGMYATYKVGALTEYFHITPDDPAGKVHGMHPGAEVLYGEPHHA